MTGGLAIVWQQRDVLLHGLMLTVTISALAAVLAAGLGFLMFLGLTGRVKVVRYGLTGVIDLMRCVPFMLFCYLIYYGLPNWGIVLGNITVGVVALSLYNATYVAELLRGAWKELPREIGEAGLAFGFHGWRLMRIVLPPVLFSAIPLLGNQLIQIIKDSAFLVIITVEELTYAANEIQSTFYVPFASFVCAVLLYWVLCLIVERAVAEGEAMNKLLTDQQIVHVRHVAGRRTALLVRGEDRHDHWDADPRPRRDLDPPAYRAMREAWGAYRDGPVLQAADAGRR
jgi:polar amino acid transport system permease protein